ncbi:SMP-30/gluconolactonase/LRE family protein [Bacillus lacus]|uniref:Regucalcin n=1 Tax=Metabacillus lacus TaxID=1983721 RepID=A0A7X2IY03_9BACI|nr:SMP-30/gluconolactonase/LRE family protein [Metabacillus lacus]MRX71896.1 SMP-30/gluconolactonase/LRE family protein [Metabacillus lacus]
MKTASVAADVRTLLGEGPVWDPRSSLLYWIDIEGQALYSLDPSREGQVNKMSLGQRPGALVLRETDGAVLAAENGFFFLDMSSGKLEEITNPEEHVANNRFNDGKADPAGRFWAGTMEEEGKKHQGSLYCLNTDMTAQRKLQNLSISNGLAWSRDNKYFYLIDTPESKVFQFHYQLDTGSISEKRTAITFPEDAGSPDGMTIDEEGMLWIAHFGGGRISRWNPDSGQMLEEVSIPAPNVTSCVFGGENLNTLYITTASIGMSDEELEKFPKAGSLFQYEPSVAGTVLNYFKG